MRFEEITPKIRAGEGVAWLPSFGHSRAIMWEPLVEETPDGKGIKFSETQGEYRWCSPCFFGLLPEELAHIDMKMLNSDKWLLISNCSFVQKRTEIPL
jgi:hypothetical protein